MLLTDTHHPNLGVTTALRMTSAAPSYFPPKVVAGEEYVDGGKFKPSHFDAVGKVTRTNGFLVFF
eukprot:m.145418 g.145418  ORF g.145418 m.145418 type:complete len:65 (-) comp24274_c0_seq9:575-769(-)